MARWSRHTCLNRTWRPLLATCEPRLGLSQGSSLIARSLQFNYFWCQRSKPCVCCSQALFINLKCSLLFQWCSRWYQSIWDCCQDLCWILRPLLDLEVAMSPSTDFCKGLKLMLSCTLTCFHKSQLASHVSAILIISCLAFAAWYSHLMLLYCYCMQLLLYLLLLRQNSCNETSQCLKHYAWQGEAAAYKASTIQWSSKVCIQNQSLLSRTVHVRWQLNLTGGTAR